MSRPIEGDKRAETGRNAEQKALIYLQAQGLQLVERNYRCRGGEIDLVMRDSKQLVMVEVRYRRSTSYLGAAASVDQRKQRRLIVAARHYLASHPQSANDPVRFDVMAFDGPASAPDIEWLRNAFDVPDF
jgi:putative endonuclease